MTFFDTSYTSPLFSLSLQREEKLMYMKMQIHSETITTKSLPHTLSILKEVCPRVLKTQCFNNDNLPFYKEVQNTEIAHMFEHILLAHLCEMCIKHEIKGVVFNGKTNWNWIREKKGLFHIYIHPIDMVSSLFYQATRRAIEITEFIMNSDSLIKPSRFFCKKNISDTIAPSLLSYKKTSSQMATRFV